MRRPGIVAAAALIVATDAFVLVKAALNRSGSPTARLELTERELRLVRPNRESTALFLRLAWEPSWRTFRFEDGAGWFGRAKLEELGYDCSVPIADSTAPAHYRAMGATEAFAVLEFRGAPVEDPNGSNLSRLSTIDAGRDLAALRRKYADARFLIVPSLVRLRYEAPRSTNGCRDDRGAYLRGEIERLLVSEVSVPPSERRVFEGLSETDDYLGSAEARSRGPRYAATLYYGRNHEPWIGGCRLLAPAPR